MSNIRIVYTSEPCFPATDQAADAVRYYIDGYVVDAIGGEPTLEEVTSFVNVVVPDVNGFLLGLKVAMGGVVRSNALAKAYPLFHPAVQTWSFPDVQALIIDAHTTGTITETDYANFKKLAAQYNIPIALP